MKFSEPALEGRIWWGGRYETRVMTEDPGRDEGEAEGPLSKWWSVKGFKEGISFPCGSTCHMLTYIRKYIVNLWYDLYYDFTLYHSCCQGVEQEILWNFIVFHYEIDSLYWRDGSQTSLCQIITLESLLKGWWSEILIPFVTNGSPNSGFQRKIKQSIAKGK